MKTCLSKVMGKKVIEWNIFARAMVNHDIIGQESASWLKVALRKPTQARSTDHRTTSPKCFTNAIGFFDN